MVNTILSDEIINSTELRNNQKRWLDKAYSSPVSIMSGNKKLVLLNREQAKHMYLLTDYVGAFIKFCREQNSGKKRESDVFPWIKHLSEEAIEEFNNELLATFEEAVYNKDWSVFEEMLDAWAATAEAMTNPEMVELIATDVSKEEFTKVE